MRKLHSALAIVAALIISGGPIHSDPAFAAPRNQKKLNSVKAKLRKKGLSAIPNTEDVLKAKQKKGKVSLTAVSGTAPTLAEIPEADITSLFWKPGVVSAIASGNPSMEQCNEFFAGNQEGASGGFGACMLTEAVGRSFEQLSEGGTSLCYMKNFPTPANVEAGGVTVVAGNLPPGGITKLFAPPTGSPRNIRVEVSGMPGENEQDNETSEDVNIRVYPVNDKLLYRVDLWFCQNGEITGRDNIVIRSDGSFAASNQSRGMGEEGAFFSRVQAKLTFGGGKPAFDLTAPRKMLAEHRNDQGAFKSQAVIRGNTVETKTLDQFGGETRRSNMISRFSGDSPEDVRFIEGAYRVVQDQGNFEGATEYRDSYYAAVTASALSSQLDSLNQVGEDAFFDNLPAEDFDLSQFSCDADADVELTLNMANESVRDSVAGCEDRPFRNMHYCFENEELRAAEQNFNDACRGDEGGPH